MPQAIENGRAPIKTPLANWNSFTPLALATLIVAATLSVLLGWIFQTGAYYGFLTALIAGGVLSIIVAGAVRFGICRSRWVGMMFGLLAGFVMFAGQFYVGMIFLWGPDFVTRWDMLPKYIEHRRDTDLHVSKENRTPHVDPGASVGNWLRDGMMMLGMCAVFGWGAAGRAYCDRCAKWKERDLAFFPSGTADELVQLITSGQASQLPTFETLNRNFQKRFVIVAVEFCPLSLQKTAQAADKPCEVYISVKDVYRGGGLGDDLQWSCSPGSFPLKRFVLNAEEIASLGGMFPDLQLLGAAHRADAAQAKTC